MAFISGIVCSVIVSVFLLQICASIASEQCPTVERYNTLSETEWYGLRGLLALELVHIDQSFPQPKVQGRQSHGDAEIEMTPVPNLRVLIHEYSPTRLLIL